MGNLQPQNEHRPESPRLGFHEIVPGSDHDASQSQDPEINIPEFDLSRQLMVEERRESAARRQGPGQRRETEPSPDPVTPEAHRREEPAEVAPGPAQARVSAYRHPVIQRHAIVEEIVRRDIQRLCMAT